MRKLVPAIALAACAIGSPSAAAETRSDLVLTAADTVTAAFDQPVGAVTCPAPPIVVTDGPVSLGGATLDLAVSRPPGAGFGCVLVDHRGAGAIAGTFAGLPEGTIFGPPSARFRITYAGGDGNDVLLKRVEVPTRIDGPAYELYLSDQPTRISVYVGGDTPTSLAAPGALDVTLDGVPVGSFPLQHSSADVDLGVLALGDHEIVISYGGGMHGGDLVFMPKTVSGTITVKPSRIPSLPGGIGQPAPIPPAPPATPPAAPVSPPAGPAPADPPAPAGDDRTDEPRPREIRAALRDVTGVERSPRRLRFSQAVAAPGELRWRLLARIDGRRRTMAARSRTVTRAGTVTARLRIGRRQARRLRAAPRNRLVLETTLVTADRTVVVRARVP